MDKLYNLTIDTKLKTYQKIYGMKQFENNVVLDITLVQNSLPVNLSGCTVRLNYENKNEVLLQMANIVSEKEGKVSVTVLTKVLDTIGETPVDISVFDADQRKITSSTFVLVVQESIYNNDKVDDEELDLIQGIFTKETERQQAENERKDNERKRISDESERVSNESTRENKEKERQANELERIENENLRKTDEQQRVKQENKREENEVVRVSGEDTRVKSMEKIQADWEVIKNDLNNLEGGGDMLKSIYDTNKNGVVDDSEKLGGVAADKFLQKQNNTTWQDININGVLETGDTSTLMLHRPNVTDKILLEPFNDNFTKLDGALWRMGAGDIKELSNVSLTEIEESGMYLIHNLVNAPDTPPSYMRDYLVEVYKKGGGAYYPRVWSLGTGKLYSYSENGYEDIPCTSPMQPRELYIDAINGDDGNNGDKEHPIKTWSCADSRIPKILTKSLEIHLVNVPSESYIELSGLSTFVPATTWTWLTIDGHNTLIDNLNILSCNFGASQWSIALQNMNINFTLNVVQSSTVNIINSKILNLNVDNSVARCSNNTVSKYSADYRAFIQLSGHNNHETQSRFGCSSTYGSLIYVNGTHPQGSASEKYMSFGGKVEYED